MANPNHHPDLPARYRALRPAGDTLTEGQSNAISLPLSLFAFGGLVALWWLSTDQLKKDQAARGARRNPRRRPRRHPR